MATGAGTAGSIGCTSLLAVISLEAVGECEGIGRKGAAGKGARERRDLRAGQIRDVPISDVTLAQNAILL